MTVRRNGFHNGATGYMLQLGEKSTTHRIFVAWVVFVIAIFSCLNLKSDDGFLPNSMPKDYNKTGRGSIFGCPY